MQLFDPNNPNEKKKIIVAAVLGVAAIAVLGYVFFGGSSKKPLANKAVTTPAPPTLTASNKSGQNEIIPIDPRDVQPVLTDIVVPAVPEANRNIFAYYVPPPRPEPIVVPPTPTPTPVPPLKVSGLAPSSVYARTADFSLQVMGDKFTPAVRIIIDGRELPTRFINPQQVATTVPASLIANPGQRQLIVRTPDNSLYSLPVMLNVTPPPLPNYNYIGIIGRPRSNDTAVLQDKASKDLMNVQRGDLLGGRFRVNSISEREIVLVDTTLKIKHTLPFTVDNSNTNQPFRQPVRTVDDEPF